MTSVFPTIDELPVNASDIINTAECIQYLPIIAQNVKGESNLDRLLKHISEIVKCEIRSHLSSEAAEVQNTTVNQVVLNIAFRTHRQLLLKHGKDIDRHKIAHLPQLKLSHRNPCSFQLLYALLLTENQISVKPQELKVECLKALELAVKENSYSVLFILKTLNLLSRKFENVEVVVSLEYIYHCMQRSQYGTREEALILFSNCCKQPSYAFDTFRILLQFWPWTNRNKHYLLSCILNTHNLNVILHNDQQCIKNFYAGMRLSLSYKSLLAASQYLVKTLSAQNSQELLVLSAEILMRGTLKEIQNFNSQWFERITQKDKLFELLQQQPEATLFLENTGNCTDNTDHFRLILIFSMFSRQIFQASKLHFFKISTELITNCFQFELEAQMLIFKFFVDNFGSFAIEDCLEFIATFMKLQKNVESAQFRNELLGKVPSIINYIAKAFSKLSEAGGATTLEASVVLFFKDLQCLIETDVTNDVYQQKIFALRLLGILHKSLYAKNLEKNAKNCIVAQNKILGNFLIETKVFDASKICANLINTLNDPSGFDDASELVVTLLQQLEYDNLVESVRCTKEFSQRCDVDECVLSTNYVRVALQSCKVVDDDVQPMELYKFAVNTLQQQLKVFNKDPLDTCNNSNHLFGYINIIREIVVFENNLLTNHLNELLDLVELASNTILELLHLSIAKSDSDSVAASFQEIDESLELLVQKSTVKTDDHVASRKFLLMSFWLTLKACCDLATTIGCILMTLNKEKPINVQALNRCLLINVSVLTRCRHKGAIEAAGLSIGTLTKCITTLASPTDKAYLLLLNCLDLLFDNTKQISVTRRGAGFSIMLLHIVKNEENPNRLILNRAMSIIMQHLKRSTITLAVPNENCDRIEVLLLHYLCVLVRDTGLRDAMSKHYNGILLATIEHIEHPEWMECNAVLQLFGALVPKIVGQKQATEFEIAEEWVSTEVTYAEIMRKLPSACEYIVTYCSTKFGMSTATRSIIMFLEFLSNVEYLQMKVDMQQDLVLLQRFRDMTWRFLAHSCEKVRQLAAICFVRTHDMRCELPCVLLSTAEILHSISNENLFQGLVFALIYGVLKLKYDSPYITECNAHECITQALCKEFDRSFKLPRQFKPYTLTKLLELFIAIGFDNHAYVKNELIETDFAPNSIGYDVWLQLTQKVSK